MQLHLVDINIEMIDAWDKVFSDVETVFVHEGNILDLAEEAIVSPANSYGYMDGGIDRLYRNFFGMQIEHTVQKAIADTGANYLPVGEALIVPTHHDRIPQMIVAPTMFLPEPIKPEKCYRAMRAILGIIESHNINQVYCPGLGTGIGQVEPMDSAKVMLKAYCEFYGG